MLMLMIGLIVGACIGTLLMAAFAARGYERGIADASTPLRVTSSIVTARD